MDGKVADLPRTAAIYALGGGYGHIVRASGLARALLQLGIPCTCLVPTTTPPLEKLLHGVPMIAIPKHHDPSDLTRALRTALSKIRPELLVVDAIPAGVLGERPTSCAPSNTRSVLVARAHQGAATATYPEQASAFDLIVDVEPHLGWLPPALARRCVPLGPVTASAKPALPLPDRWRRPDALLVSSDPQLSPFLRKLAMRLTKAGLRVLLSLQGAVSLTLEPPTPYFPLSVLAVQPRIVIGASGYNLTYEVAAAGIAHVAIPLARAWDMQKTRAEAMCYAASSPQQLERLVFNLLEQGTTAKRHDVVVRGTEDLARLVANRPAPAASRASR